MATLTGSTIASSYEQLLSLPDGGGNTTTLVAVTDGDAGTTFAMQLSTTTLCIDNATTSSATQGGVLRLQSDDGAVMASGHRLGVIEFGGAEDTSSTITTGARIEALADATWSASENGADLVMYTTDGNAAQAENMRIYSDSTSGVQIQNTTTSSATEGGKLKLTADDGAALGDTHRLGVIEFNAAEDGSNNITTGARIEAIADAAWSASENGADMVFYTTDGNASQSEVMRLTADAGTLFSKPVTVGADDLGHDVIFYGDTASSNMTWDTSGDTLIINDAQLKIDQDDDVTALLIDSESTSNYALSSSGKFACIFTQDISAGYAANFYRNIAESGSKPLVNITNDHADNGQSSLFSRTDGNSQNTMMEVQHASYASNVLYMQSSRAPNSGFNFLKTNTEESDDQHILRGDGEAYADASWNASGADYAEYFESSDGAVIPVGTTVKIDSGKVVSCSVGDTPIGVVRPSGSVSIIGNNQWGKWRNKYLRTDYGGKVMEEYSQTEWDEGEGEDKIWHTYQTDKIPDNLTVPDDAIVTTQDKNGNSLMRKKLNPDYNPDLEYVDTENRDEWHIVGLLGQVPITKGQPVADNWIKMKDVSDTVEMWFVK